MKHLLFVFIVLSFFACDTEQGFNKADLYSGTVEIIWFRQGEVISQDTFNLQVKLSDNKFYRVDEEGNQGCFGDLDKQFGKIQFKSGECACWCECNPLVDCMGDFLLGNWDIIHESDERLELEFRQVLTATTNGEPNGEWKRYVILEKE